MLFKDDGRSSGRQKFTHREGTPCRGIDLRQTEAREARRSVGSGRRRLHRNAVEAKRTLRKRDKECINPSSINV